MASIDVVETQNPRARLNKRMVVVPAVTAKERRPTFHCQRQVAAQLE